MWEIKAGRRSTEGSRFVRNSNRSDVTHMKCDSVLNASVLVLTYAVKFVHALILVCGTCTGMPWRCRRIAQLRVEVAVNCMVAGLMFGQTDQSFSLVLGGADGSIRFFTWQPATQSLKVLYSMPILQRKTNKQNALFSPTFLGGCLRTEHVHA